MKEHPIFAACMSVTLVALLSWTGLASYIKSAPQGGDRGQGDRGQADLHRDDPCTHLPDPPGRANGIDKKCPAAGSSSGVAKGDFNGDGFADLAIGEPGATISNRSSAGDVIVLNGEASGLTTAGRQLFYLSRIPAVQTVRA